MFRIILLFTLCLFCILPAKAQNQEIMGSWITYKKLDPTHYEVTLNMIRECSGNSNIKDTIHMRGPKTSVKQKATLIDSFDIRNNICSTKSICKGGTYKYGFQQRVYRTIFDVSSVSDSIVNFEWGGNLRYSKINNGYAGMEHYNMAIVDLKNGNSSPDFFNKPQILVRANSDHHYVFKFADTVERADYNTYKHTQPLLQGLPCSSCSTVFVTYLGFPNTAPPLKPPAGLYFDEPAATISYRPVKLKEVGNYAIQINEYRMINGTHVKVGTIYYDMTVIIEGDSLHSNRPPQITLSGGTMYNSCGKQQLAVNFSTKDQDSTDSVFTEVVLHRGSLKIDSVVKSGQQEAGIIYLSGPEIPDSPFTNQPILISVTATDKNCQIEGRDNRPILVYLRPTPQKKYWDFSKTISSCNSVTWSKKVKTQYSWFLTPGTWQDVESGKTSISDSFSVTYHTKGWKKMAFSVSDKTYNCSEIFYDSVYLDSIRTLDIVTATDTLCKPDSVSLVLVSNHGHTPASVLWDDGNTSMSRNIFTSVDRNISAKAIYPDGCELSDSIKITRIYPTITRSNNVTACKDDSVHVSASVTGLDSSTLAKTTLSWPGQGSKYSFAASASAEIKITATVSSYCTLTDSISVKVNPLPQFSLSDSMFCKSDSFANTSLVYNGASPIKQVLWNNTPGTPSYKTLTTNLPLRVTTILKDSNQCSYKKETDLDTFPQILSNLSVNDSVFCQQDSVVKIDALFSGTANEILWNGTKGNSSFNLKTNSLPAKLNILLKDIHQCSLAKETFLDTFPLINVAIIAWTDAVCEDAAKITLNATPTGGVWSGSYVVNNTFETSSASPGNYALTYSFTDNNNCTSKATKTLEVIALPQSPAFTANVSHGNAPFNIILTENSGNSYDSLLWTISRDSGIIFQSHMNPFNYTLTDSGHYHVAIKVFSSGCSVGVTKMNSILVFPTGTFVTQLNDHDIKIYPNPTSHEIFVHTDKTSQLDIYDLSGRLLRTEVLPMGERKINLADLNPGIYFLKISSEGSILYTQKIEIIR